MIEFFESIPLKVWEEELAGEIDPMCLDGIETGVRQLIRDEPLETRVMDFMGKPLLIPTEAEMLRIKAVLILKRNATRDYLDFVALADHMGDRAACLALQSFDRLYPQASGESSAQQLQVQLASCVPYDLDAVAPSLPEYKNLNARWHDWAVVDTVCRRLSGVLFDAQCGVPFDA